MDELDKWIYSWQMTLKNDKAAAKKYPKTFAPFIEDDKIILSRLYRVRQNIKRKIKRRLKK